MDRRVLVIGLAVGLAWYGWSSEKAPVQASMGAMPADAAMMGMPAMGAPAGGDACCPSEASPAEHDCGSHGEEGCDHETAADPHAMADPHAAGVDAMGGMMAKPLTQEQLTQGSCPMAGAPTE